MSLVRALLGATAIVGALWAVGAGATIFYGHMKGQQPASVTMECAEPRRQGEDRVLPPEPTRGDLNVGARASMIGHPAASGLAKWPGIIDATPQVADLDGDADAEFIAHAGDGRVYVFDPTTGRALASLPTTCPNDWYMERVLNTVQAATLRPGLPVSLVVTDHAAFVANWRLDAAASDGGALEFRRQWQHRMDDCHPNPSMDAAATVADADGDGTLEVFVQTEELGLFALNADGRTRWKHCWAGGNSAPVVADLDADGVPEVVFASDAGLLSVLDASTGAPQWSFDARDPRWGIQPASIPVSPTVADLDGVLPLEVLFTARHAPSGDPSRFPEFHMAIFAVHRNVTTWQGELVWMRQPEWAHPLSYTRLVVKDVDADGAPDIFGMDWNTIGHSPGNWEILGPAHVFRLTARGDEVWNRTVEVWWSNKDIAVADVNGDGSFDVLANGARDQGDGLWWLSADTGDLEGFVPLSPWKMMRGPVIIDSDEGPPRLLLSVAPRDPRAVAGALLVVDLASVSFAPGGEAA